MPIIASSGPVFLCLSSILFLKEKTHPKALLGTMVSLLGIIIFVGQPLVTNGFDISVIGNLFFVLAMLGSVVHTIIGKTILNKYRAVAITFWSFLIGAGTFFPLFIYELAIRNPFAHLDHRGILGIVFGIIFSSTIAYLLFDWGIKRLDGQEIGVFTYVDPIAAALIAIPLLGEQITPIFLIGALLIFGGIAIAEGRFHYHPIQKLRR